MLSFPSGQLCPLFPAWGAASHVFFCPDGCLSGLHLRLPPRLGADEGRGPGPHPQEEGRWSHFLSPGLSSRLLWDAPFLPRESVLVRGSHRPRVDPAVRVVAPHAECHLSASQRVSTCQPGGIYYLPSVSLGHTWHPEKDPPGMSRGAECGRKQAWWDFSLSLQKELGT